MTKLNKVTHVIFDLDGLLLDTEAIYTVATNAWLAPFNKTFPFEVKLKMMGRAPLEAAKILIDSLEIDCTPKTCVDELEDHIMELFPTCSLMPGADDLVQYLRSKGVPMAICTGSSKRYYQRKIINHKDFFGLFDFVVCCPDDPDVKHGKPNPDCFLVAASRFAENPDPKSVLVFEDALNGAQAARDAGMQCILVPDPRVDRKLCDELATLTLNSLSDFEPALFGL